MNSNNSYSTRSGTEPLRRLSEPVAGLPLSSSERRAAELLSQLPKPPVLSPAAFHRIEEKLLVERASRPFWALGLGGLAAATAAAVFLLRPAPRPESPAGLALQSLQVPAGGSAVLATETGMTLLLDGPGSLRTGESAAHRLEIVDGQAVLSSGERGGEITVAGSRVVLGPKRAVAISVRLGELVRVAAYRESVRVESPTRSYDLAAGTAWTADGVQPLSASCLEDVAKAFSVAGSPELLALGRSAACAITTRVEPKAAAAVVPVETVAAAEAPEAAAPRELPRPHAARPRRGSDGATLPAVAVAPPPPAVSPTPAAEPSESRLLAESRLLGAALQELRQKRDAGKALRSLDEYQQQFPSGQLGEEARAARIEALLQLDRRGEALSLLDKLELSRLSRGELRVVRGELRATAGRCSEALSDFAAVDTEQAPAAVGERALYGQASCLTSLGQRARARGALSRYLEKYPMGKHAAQVRKALVELDGEAP